MKVIYLPGTSALLLAIASLALPESDAATPSTGCTTNPSPAAGTWDASTNFDGSNYSHKYSYPSGNFDGTNPPPLLLFFHGWGGSSSDCGSTCTAADSRGYATVSLTGIAAAGENNSWNGFGSIQSNTGAADQAALTAGSDTCGVAAEDDRTCNTNAYQVGCYADCGGSCADDCWWTTCKDSVQQAVNVLEDFLDGYCVDMEKVYAVGCSNGGMFTYELANDERSAKYLAGISTQVGLPHYGYNRGPHANYKIHHLGFWGRRDTTVPPKENSSSESCSVPCRTSENNGWFYTSWECTLTKWKDDLGLANFDPDPSDYGIPSKRKLTECQEYSGAEDDAVVLGCIFGGGHVCNTSYMNAVTLNFFDANKKVGAVNPTTSMPTKSPTPPGPATPAPTNSPTSSPTKKPVGGCTNRFDVPPLGSDCFVDCCNKSGCWNKGGRAGECK